MRIAIPIAGSRLAMHFGHCREFAFYDVDPTSKTITNASAEAAPDHQPGLLPRWLADRNVDLIIAGGMGSRAQALFAQSGIDVVLGATETDPQALVQQFSAGTLEQGENVCDH